MFKTMVLVAGLAAVMASSAEAADGRGIREGGCLPATYKGKLMQKRIRIAVRCITPDVNNLKEEIGIGPRRPLYATHWVLETAGGPLQLDLGDSKPLWKQAGELLNKQVIVTGMSRGGRIAVVGLKADETVVRTGKLVRELEILDNAILPREPGKIYLPIGFRFVVKWYVEIDGTRHALALSPELARKATALAGKNVKVTGQMSGTVLTVEALEAVAAR